ncbi:uncharacterized protein A4U43_C05F4710 [Asparagus officinalis]|uniref:Laccase n=1 Tax=Asparagus officinalis TaxID=4686 RepID=A0A5P1EPD4_ASPOF|nr:laccase-3-like [Asparagus officinalis]ONK67875.1 uncharacterized protein A4U43_C05F4710 [Asparagus officinalis]
MEARTTNLMIFSLICLFLCLSLLFICINAEVHYHDFVLQETPVKRLCQEHKIITMNGQLPGPTLKIRNGDSLVINVMNRARYNVTVHWHGVRQMTTAWADGPEFVTQCPIRPGGSYTYRFTIKGQEGTLWWHAHSSWLRATVYGALIIYPREHKSYPYPKPHREALVTLGEWWNTDPVQVVRQATMTGAAPAISDAYTINGQPGDLYNCSSKGTTIIPAAFGETILLRFINAALNNEFFISIAGHTMTVVGADAAYNKPFVTSVLMLGPGQTTDVLVTTSAPPGKYYIAARAYASAQGVQFNPTTTTAILEYRGAGCGILPPLMPLLPAYNDTFAATAIAAGYKSLSPVTLPGPVDEHLFITVGVGLLSCPPGRTCQGPGGTRFAASMNNYSFVLPSTISILEAQQFGVPGVFTTDFPAVPPVQFDYTADNISQDLWQPVQATKVYPLKYGSVVQIVLQGTNIVAGENHPVHLHGYDFYVLATGFGNFDAERDTPKFNLIDPPLRNTVGLPVKGWAVIRFMADNPGAWIMHCHLDVHITWGLAMVFVVENGVGPSGFLQPPPVDLPHC